ncbi:recombinase family protein [Aminipila sp.]|uniref:recombinase family protein n=1 Tax=Aminipila sp. TaxID=2060095 RepID=UPI00289EE9B2|nr:recombinase family protein [Aminipila sp.]
MKTYGYHRTSTNDQHLDRGVNEIQEYCKVNNLSLEKIFTDQQTGKNFNRPRYTIMKEDVLRAGDILLITEIDRLGRNKEDTLKELRYYKEKGIRVMILEIPTTLVDYSSLDNSMAKMIMETINNMLIEMYTVFAQVEIEKKEKRQREGIEAMKARGEWSKYGRPKAIDYDIFVEAYKRVLEGKKKPFECMRELGMTKATFYRYRKEYELGM